MFDNGFSGMDGFRRLRRGDGGVREHGEGGQGQQVSADHQSAPERRGLGRPPN